MRGNWKQINEKDALDQADFYWRPVNLSFAGYHYLDKLTKSRFILNHFEVINGICTKTQLIKSLNSYYDSNEAAKKENYSTFDSTPTTFVLARTGDDREIYWFLHRHR